MKKLETTAESIKKKATLFIWRKLTNILYRQGFGWLWMQKQVEEISSHENYKVAIRRLSDKE